MLIPPTLARIPAAGLSSRRPPTERPTPTPNLFTTPVLRDCPECCAPLSRASACLNCPACGWGKCG